MEKLMGILTDPVLLLTAALALLVVALAMLAKRGGDREKALVGRVEQAERALTERYAQARDAEDALSAKGREEMSANLRGMGDSVTRVMGEMARTQQAQLDAFAAQIRDLRGAEESRADAACRAVEEGIDRLGDAMEEKLARMRQDNAQGVSEIRVSLEQKLDATLDRRLGDSFRAMSDRLEQVYKGLGEMQTLASGVGDLKKVLTGVRNRGLIGEIQLSALLSQVLSPDQYEKGVRLTDGGEACDFAIRLPGRGADGGMCYLPVDARFPQEAYLRLTDAVDAGDADKAELAGNELERRLIEAAERIADQFINPPHTTEFAVLFLASEGLYAEALRRAALPETLQREYHVTLTGPSTLAALLNSLQMGFRTLALEKRSEEVWTLLGAVRGEFGTFAEALSRTQKRIRQASESIEDAAKKSRTIEKKLKGVDKLDGDQREALLSDAGEETEAYGSGDWD